MLHQRPQRAPRLCDLLEAVRREPEQLAWNLEHDRGQAELEPEKPRHADHPFVPHHASFHLPAVLQKDDDGADPADREGDVRHRPVLAIDLLITLPGGRLAGAELLERLQWTRDLLYQAAAQRGRSAAKVSCCLVDGETVTLTDQARDAYAQWQASQAVKENL
jgi:hypothetical protein